MTTDGPSDPADPRWNAFNHLVTDLDGQPVAIDVRRALLADHATVSLTADPAGVPCFAVQLEGSTAAVEEVRLLVLLDGEGVATLVSLLIEAAAHAGGEYLAELLAAIGQRVTG